MHSSNLGPGIRQVKPGNKIGDIGHAIERVVRGGGYRVVPELTGHGIGYKLHEEPYVYNYGKPHNGPAMKPGPNNCNRTNSRKR